MIWDQSETFHNQNSPKYTLHGKIIQIKITTYIRFSKTERSDNKRLKAFRHKTKLFN